MAPSIWDFSKSKPYGIRTQGLDTRVGLNQHTPAHGHVVSQFPTKRALNICRARNERRACGAKEAFQLSPISSLKGLSHLYSDLYDRDRQS